MLIAGKLGLLILFQVCHLENEESDLPCHMLDSQTLQLSHLQSWDALSPGFPWLLVYTSVLRLLHVFLLVKKSLSSPCWYSQLGAYDTDSQHRYSTILPHLDFFICSYSHLWNTSDFPKPTSREYWHPPEMCGLVFPHVEVLRRQHFLPCLYFTTAYHA